ncbi:hypothetical protein [Saccharopolyspora griseoalba]|uniref:Uncharacterized protein n=1 Tax=Saccharopolyspora griseoalba TaxID=1431848 RepID=A0ABW2LLY8_9PSEU
MTMTVQLTRPTTRLDRLVEQLQEMIGFFAAQPQPSHDAPDEHPRAENARTSDRLPPTSEFPGDPVDTSHHDPNRAPADEAGGLPASRESGRDRDEQQR